ncbi:hypothetical protein IMSAGC014_02265 [Bacteroidaceae bacterium]|nr:hypothetical protein IMSAGC014_02265 [Bacteroidaceae bacterium]
MSELTSAMSARSLPSSHRGISPAMGMVVASSISLRVDIVTSSIYLIHSTKEGMKKPMITLITRMMLLRGLIGSGLPSGPSTKRTLASLMAI